MRLLKHLVLVLSLLPMLSFASFYEQKDVAMDATYNKVSPACYRMFKTAFGFLPEFAETKGIGVSNVKTPSGNPSTYTFRVDSTPNGIGVGNYGIYQKYSDKHKQLYLRLDTYAADFPLDHLDNIWAMIGEAVDACGIVGE